MPKPNKQDSLINYAIGTRIKERRICMGYTRKQIADKINITHQQIGKYEIGKDRVSACRLKRIADELGCEVSYFFEDSPVVLANEHQRMAMEVAKNFLKVKSRKIRKSINDHIRELAGG